MCKIKLYKKKGGYIMEFQQFKNVLSNLYFDGFRSAYNAHETLFSIEFDTTDSRRQELISCSLAFLSEAYTTFQNIRILTITEDEDRSEFEDCYNQFSTFNNEMLNNVKTDHSHQWTDIEFREFANAFKVVKDLLNIEHADHWLNKVEGL